jgi:hypothetical protein
LKEPVKLSAAQRFWRQHATDVIYVQRLSDRYVFIFSAPSRYYGEVLYALDAPLNASNTVFRATIEKLLQADTAARELQLTRATAKRSYFADIRPARKHWRLVNRHGLEHETIHVQISDDGCDISTYRREECVHQAALPSTARLHDLVVAIRQGFAYANDPPKHRFPFESEIALTRVDDRYFFHGQCRAGLLVLRKGMHELPVSTTDARLGAALVAALSEMPRLTPKEARALPYQDLPGESSPHAVRGGLRWSGISSPPVLVLRVSPPGGGSNAPVTLRDDASVASVGNWVRTTMAAQVARARRGIPNEQLALRLDKEGFFEFAKRESATRRAVVKNGWGSFVETDLRRCFHADQEDLAEGGVGRFIDSIKPFLSAAKVKIGKIHDDVRDGSYDVRIDGKCYPILLPGDLERSVDEPGHSWAIASHRTATLLDLLMRSHGRKELAYSVEGGNDHHFLFITPAMFATLQRGQGFEKRHGPYRSTSRPPDYGYVEY